MVPRRFGGRLGTGLVLGMGLWLVISALAPAAPLAGSDGARATAAVTPDATLTLIVPGITPSAISLNWTEATDALFAEYTVAYSTAGATGPWQNVGTINVKTTTQFADAGFAPGATYWWMVTETGDLGETSSSNVVEVTQPSDALLTESTVSSTEVQFNWTNNATYGGLLEFQSYEILASLDGHAPSIAATVNDVATRATSVSGLAPGSSYWFYLNTSDCYANCAGATPSLSVSESNSVSFGTPLPLAASATATRPTVDVGQSDTFSCTASGGQPPYSYAWNFGNGSFLPGNRSVAQSFTTVGPISATCEVTDNESTSIMAATTIVVATDPTPAASANRTTADVGQPIQFNCSATGGQAPYSYTWSFGDGTSASTSEPTHPYATAGDRAAICTVTDATSTEVAASVSLNITPTLLLAVSASAGAAAPGTSLTFLATASNGSGNYTAITWSFGDGTTGSGATTEHRYATAGNFTARANVTDSNGAAATASVAVVIAPLVVTLGSAAVASASPGQLLSYSATASGGAGGPYNYTWTFGDGTTSYGASVTHKFAQVGTYPVTLQVSDRLGATHLTTLTTVDVSVPPPPAPLVTAPLLIGLAILFGLVAFLIGVVIRRRRQDQAYAALAGRVPVTDPARTIQGSRICRVCGAPNLPVRKTCEACGASLRGPLIR